MELVRLNWQSNMELASELHQQWNWTLSLQLARDGCGGSASVTA